MPSNQKKGPVVQAKVTPDEHEKVKIRARELGFSGPTPYMRALLVKDGAFESDLSDENSLRVAEESRAPLGKEGLREAIREEIALALAQISLTQGGKAAGPESKPPPAKGKQAGGGNP